MKTLINYINEKLLINKGFKNDEEYFIYKIDKKDHIRIFDKSEVRGWPHRKDYKNKVYINNRLTELDDNGCTVELYDPGEYIVYIEDLDKITTCESMFWSNQHIINVPYFNTTNINNMHGMFGYCSNLEKVPQFDTKNVKDMSQMFYGCIELRDIPLLEISKDTNTGAIFHNKMNLNSECKEKWLNTYDWAKYYLK